MAKRLNPKRRAEMRARYDAIARNPSTQTETGAMRSNAGQLVMREKAPPGSSDGLARGILRLEANPVVYAKHKRRKAVAKATHVNPKDVEKIPTPETVKESLNAPWPLPRKTAKKLWSNS